MPQRSEKTALQGVAQPLLLLVAACVAILPAACTTRQVSPPPSTEMAGMGPLLTVERFLQAVNARDYVSMAALFGNAEGPIEGERTELEVRMDLMARILRHRDYGIASQDPVPGRQHPTTRIGVDLQIERQRVPDVGFMVVRSNDGRWLVEEIDLEKVTNR
ncbi:MAG TPA: hypothetical protein VLL48_13220 [Longimicrobiales bacterium]|nr:hypothetical protein [Longimicrobiales bacterium]